MIICGIDPGKNGAIVFLNDKLEFVNWDIMPIKENEKEVDSKVLGDLLNEYKPNIVYLEKLQPIFGAGKGSMFQMARHYQAVISTLDLLGIPYKLIRAASWQQAVFHEANVPELRKPTKVHQRPKRDTKAMAYRAFKELYPSVGFRVTDKTKKDHDGAVDAILIARYYYLHP